MEEELINNPQDIRLNEQNQVQAILGRPPGWILQWGITFVALAVLSLVGVSWIVRYPDIIEAKVKLITENPPLDLYAQTEGKLSELLVDDKETVTENQLIGVIENSANHKDVERLEILLTKLENKSKTKIPDDLELGELQIPFSNFCQNQKDYNFFKGKKEVRKKVKALKSQIRYLRRKIVSNDNRKLSIKKEQGIAEENLARMELLLADSTVSKQEKEIADRDVIQIKRQLESIDSESLDNKMKIKELEVQIIDLESGREDDGNSKELELEDNIFSLQGEIEQWKKKYLIVAPVSGQISFPRNINRNQFVKSGQKLMTILPPDGVGEVIGNALLSSEGFGKVKKDSTVYIRLDAFPYKEFGSVVTRVKDLPLSPQEDGMYLVDLELVSPIENNNLITTSNDTIPFRQELEGTARVITEDRRIFQRLFDELFGLFEK